VRVVITRVILKNRNKEEDNAEGQKQR